MTIRVYGHYGLPIIVFPCQDKLSDDMENNGMIDVLSPLINDGKIKLFCLDSNDDETVSFRGYDKGYASYKLDCYHEYFINEVLPFVYDRQGGMCYPYLIGMSMGATHASNNFFRRPELFSGFIALSGAFDLTPFFGDYFDEKVYRNSPNHYLAGMNKDHPYIGIYNSKTMIVMVGDGAYEYLVRDSNIHLKEICDEKGINVDFNFWDQNSIHDWVSWKYSLPYFINKIV